MTDDIIKFIKEQIRKEPIIILTQLKKLVKNKFKVDLTKMTIYRVINDNNITRKKLRKRYYPQKKDEKKELVQLARHIPTSEHAEAYVRGVVIAENLNVGPEVEALRQRFLADYKDSVFDIKVRGPPIIRGPFGEQQSN